VPARHSTVPGMRARVPLDIDLEDKLLYGLTPMRLAYLAVALVGGLALWSSAWASSPVRVVCCLAVVATGGIAAWGRWRGRPVDGWVGDISIFVINTRRVAWNIRWMQLLKHRPGRLAPIRPQRGPISITVAGRAPKAGATTVAAELVACLATKRFAQDLWSVKQAPAGHDHVPSASDPLLTVAAVDDGRLCYLDRGTGPYVAGLIPEDASVRHARLLNRATVLAFPDAPASRAFRELAEVIAATG
jgi:hypothetical protein